MPPVLLVLLVVSMLLSRGTGQRLPGFCAKDTDCRFLGDDDATCNQQGCVCGPLFGHPAPGVQMCAFGGDAAESVPVNVVFTFPEGSYERWQAWGPNGAADRDFASLLQAAGFPSFEVHFVLDAPLLVSGEMWLPAQRVTADLPEELAAAVAVEDPLDTAVLRTVQGTHTVSIDFIRLPCEATYAVQTAFLRNQCHVRRCSGGHTVEVEDGALAHCSHHRSLDLGPGDIAGIVVASVLLLLLLLLVVWRMCCAREEGYEEAQDEEMGSGKDDQSNDPFGSHSHPPSDILEQRRLESLSTARRYGEEEEEVVAEEPMSTPESQLQALEEKEREEQLLREEEMLKIVAANRAAAVEVEKEAAAEERRLTAARRAAEEVRLKAMREAAEAQRRQLPQEWAARTLQSIARCRTARQRYLASLPAWKSSQERHRHMLANGLPGFLGCGLNTKMLVTAVSPNGPAAQGGLEVGDLVVVVFREGRGGRMVPHPVPSRQDFLNSVGPQSEVFEGSRVDILVIRDEAAQRAWRALNPPRDNPSAWLAAASVAKGALPLHVVLGAESSVARRPRAKRMKELKELRGLTKMDVGVVNDIISNPEMCREFTRKVFGTVDVDCTGTLNAREVAAVLREMAVFTGCEEPSSSTAKRLFCLMDTSGLGEVSFEDFFPYFRAHQIKEIVKLGTLIERSDAGGY